MAHSSELVIIRHAHSLEQTGTPECLSANGIEQAELLANHLANHPELKPEALCSSTLPRARETAEILAEALSLSLELDDNLVEARTDLPAGAPPEQAVAAWEKFRLDVEVPPFAGAESFKAFQKRVLAAVDRITARHPKKRVALVTHGGVIEALFFAFLRIRLEDNIAAGPIVSYTGITHFIHEEYMGQPGYRLKLFNSTSHLVEL